jgi:hypothetical protein
MSLQLRLFGGNSDAGKINSSNDGKGCISLWQIHQIES